MDWNELRKQGYIEISGKRYDLSHFRVFSFQFNIPATSSYPEVNGEIEVKFSSHCVSVGPRRSEDFDFDKIGVDQMIMDGTGIKRCFCPDRHTLSHGLRDIIRSLPDGRQCYFTGHENWVTVEVLGAGRIQQFYDIFFKLRRKSDHELFMYVESAFVRSESKRHTRPKRNNKRRKIGSRLLLSKTLRGEPIMPPPT